MKYIIFITGILLYSAMLVTMREDAHQSTYVWDAQPSVVYSETGESKMHITHSYIEWVRDRETVENKFAEYLIDNPVPKGYELRGLAVYTDTECTIYAIEPEDVDDHEAMQIVGHELMHCFVGSFHPDVE